jgi:serine/threonine-protein kinase
MAHLASGGMANVYLGRAIGAAGFARLVAIKCLHPHIAADQQFVTMFLDEARLAARIRHPNVVATLDLERSAEGLYLVMEYVEGDSLLGLLRNTVKANRPIPAGVAIRIMLDALAGLHAAHELTDDHGIPLQLVHRDVSPHNIMVGTDGVTRLTDFGIARAEERVSHTRDGQLKGKLSYMAPEQTTSDPVDRRVDIFTAGIVLWECLASKRLFRGNTDAEVLRSLVEHPIPRLRDVAPAYPQALDDVVARALRRPVDERFDTAAEFAEALEEAAEPLGIASPKAVGAYVRELVGAQIEDVQRKVRAFAESRPVSAPPPAQTSSDDSSVRARSGTPVGVARYPSSPDTGTTSTRRPILIAIAAAALVLIGASVATGTLLFAASRATPPPPPPVAAATQRTETPTPTATEAPTSTSAVASATPSATPTTKPTFHGTWPAATTRPTATGKSSAAPVGSAFNPESM